MSKSQSFEGIEQGRAEATSNLVSALQTLSKSGVNELFLRSAGTSTDQSLSYQTKTASLDAYFQGVRQLQGLSTDFFKNAAAYANGKRIAIESNPTNVPIYEKAELNLGNMY